MDITILRVQFGMLENKVIEHLGTKTIQEFIKEMIKESMKKK